MTAISKIKDPVARLAAFILEREKVRMAKETGALQPWTTDEVLANYRFCCVRREDDRVTRWISDNWRTPHANDPDLWFAMCVARLLNRPESLAELGYPVPWNKVRFASTMKRRKVAGEKIFNAAYIVSTNGISIDKLAYIAHSVLDPLWEGRSRLRPKQGDTLNSYHMLLGQTQGFGSFMSAQVVADLKYVEPLRSASDWMTFSASGPGSRRGLNYVLGRERKASWSEEEWRMEARRLQDKINPLLVDQGMEELHGQDVQNCLCEWSKYWRAVTEGKMPKQKYRSADHVD